MVTCGPEPYQDPCRLRPLRCAAMKKIIVLALLVGASLFAAKKLRA
jgi:hypothetical protein